MVENTCADELHANYSVSTAQKTQFQEQGFIKLKNVFSPQVLDYYGQAITEYVLANNDLAEVPMEDRNTYQKAFIQVTNLWRDSDTVRAFVFGRRLAQIAADLLQVSGVRLYHDQALYKEPSGGVTPWHADQQYWPLATDRTITAWVPLHAVPIEAGPLTFAAGSQQMTFGRDLEISDASEAEMSDALERSDYSIVEQPFDVGEVSFHRGWTYHKAGPNTTTTARRIMTIITMDEQMVLKRPENSNQQRDWESWCPGVQVGQVIDTPLNPVLFSRDHGFA
jgi:ectoine hydroxylase-related dioxygenase (phytanoyl-CoA dioxygenase family)